MDKSKTPGHDCRLCRCLTLCRAFNSHSLSPSAKSQYHDSQLFHRCTWVCCWAGERLAEVEDGLAAAEEELRLAAEARDATAADTARVVEQRGSAHTEMLRLQAEVEKRDGLLSRQAEAEAALKQQVRPGVCGSDVERARPWLCSGSALEVTDEAHVGGESTPLTRRGGWGREADGAGGGAAGRHDGRASHRGESLSISTLLHFEEPVETPC
jgi:hypothetical protein